MLHILICDDDKIFAEELKVFVEKEMQMRQIEFESHLFGCGEDFLKENGCQDELIFMDIELPDISGLTIAQYLKEKNRNRNLIFLTNHDYLVFSSLRCFPFCFMQKSRLAEDIGSVMEEFWKERYKIIEGDRIFEYCIKNQVYHVMADDIMYLTYWEHRISIIMKDGKKIEFRGKIKECEQQLEGLDFFKTNKGTFVNLKYCQRLDENGFWMKNGENISVSRERKKNAKICFMKYRREKNEDCRNDHC